MFWQSLWEEGRDGQESRLSEGPFTLPVAGLVVGAGSESNCSSERSGGSERRNRVAGLVTFV